MDLYGGKKKIPRGEENYLFLYSISRINDDCMTAVIDYESKYIEEEGYEWKNFPDVDGDDESIENYRLDLLKTDHDLFNKYQGRINKKINDQKDLDRKMEDDRKKSSQTDVSDINRRIEQEGQTAYAVLLLEFEASGEEEEHIISRGGDTGKITAKQQWSKFVLCRSDYSPHIRIN